MLGAVWVLLLVLGFLAAAYQGDIGLVTAGALAGAAQALELIWSLSGGIMLWLGLLALLRESGLMQKLARLFAPFMRRLFPEVSADSPALGDIVLNFCANLLGLGNAATPFGIRAMQELERDNPEPGRATDSMITLLLLNTTAPTLLPTTIIALRAAGGSANPAEIVPLAFAASLFGLAVGLLAHWALVRRERANG